jgi:hypothetical protein
MMHADCIKFFEEVISAYWPDYEPDKGGKTFGLWKKILSNLDYQTAETAAEELKLSKWVGKIPDPGKFREIANKLVNRGLGSRTNESGLPEPTVFLICVESGPQVLAGKLEPVNVQGDNSNQQYVVDCGLAQAERYTNLYGGKWEVYQQTNAKDMIAIRTELSKNNPKPKFKPAAEALGTAIQQATKGLK